MSRQSRVFSIVALVLLLGSALPCHLAYAEAATSPIDISVLGQYGGGATSLALRDSLLYAGIGPRLVIYDVTDASAPQELGKSEVLPGPVMGVDVSGSYAYVAIYGIGLRILDVSNPASPSLLGAYDSPGDASAVTVSGTRAFLADGAAGLALLDVSTPAEPRLLDALDTPDYACRVAVYGDHAYVADEGGGLQVVSIAEDGAMTPVRTIDTVGDARDIAIQGSVAYVVAEMSGGGLRVYDLTDPADPVEIAALAGSALDIVVVGNRAYLVQSGGYGTDQGSLRIVDISSPANPQTVAVEGVFGYSDVAVSGSHVYTASGERGIRVYDLGDAEFPEIARFSGSGFTGLAVRDSLVYALGRGELFTIDAADPTQPKLLNRMTRGLGWWASNLVAVRDLLYAVDGDGLKVIDVTDPLSPTLVGRYYTPGLAGHVVISGTVALVADGGSGLVSIDITDPISPTLLGRCDTSGQAYRTALDGSLAYVADWSSLQIIDVSSPSAPSLAGTLGGLSMAVDVDLVPPYAYVTTLYDGVYVIDVSEPQTPTVSSILDMGDGLVSGLTRSGDLLFVSTGTGSGAVVDVSEPATPQILTTYTTPSGGGGQLVGNLLYVGGRGGLVIMHTSLPSSADTTAEGGALAHYDSEGQATTVSLPAGAVTETTTLVYTPQDAPGAPPAGLAFAGRAFSLEAYRDDVLLPDFAFAQPVTLTLEYTDAEVAGLDERTLTLHTWDGAGWVDAATTCSPASAYLREPQENRLSVAICHLSEYALFGREPHVYLPLTIR